MVITADGITAADVLGVMMLALVAVPALFGLRALRRRASRRFELMRQWAAVDRGQAAAVPTRYGTTVYPHPRFFNAGVVLAAALLLALAVGAGADRSDGTELALLPCLIVAGLFAWSTVAKYAGRHRWAARERMMRTQAAGSAGPHGG